jgi:2-iminobutanoate/2-iminopropanoate deaminase
MGRKVVYTEKAPKPVGPYSQAIHLPNDIVFTSGQIGMDPSTGELADGIEAQTRQSLTNLQEVLHEAGGHMDSILKTTVFITDMSNFDAVNGVYAEFFKDEFPARSCVQVAALPKGALVEIECIARV